jgi:hypothetical protein
MSHVVIAELVTNGLTVGQGLIDAVVRDSDPLVLRETA